MTARASPAAVYVEKFKQWRVTLLPGVLLAAKHTVFLVAGEDKAEAVREVFQDEYDPKKYPAQIAQHQGRGVTWFLDQAAARLLDRAGYSIFSAIDQVRGAGGYAGLPLAGGGREI